MILIKFLKWILVVAIILDTSLAMASVSNTKKSARQQSGARIESETNVVLAFNGGIPGQRKNLK
jgi:hypothetical protein